MGQSLDQLGTFQDTFLSRPDDWIARLREAGNVHFAHLGEGLQLAVNRMNELPGALDALHRRKETLHTRTMAWLMSGDDPAARSAALAFAKFFNAPVKSGDVIRVRSEFDVKADGRVDLCLEADSWVLFVEVKVDAGFQSGQLKKYQRALNAYRGRRTGVLGSLRPSSHRGKVDAGVVDRTLQALTWLWLETAAGLAPGRRQIALLQYVRSLGGVVQLWDADSDLVSQIARSGARFFNNELQLETLGEMVVPGGWHPDLLRRALSHGEFTSVFLYDEVAEYGLALTRQEREALQVASEVVDAGTVSLLKRCRLALIEAAHNSGSPAADRMTGHSKKYHLWTTELTLRSAGESRRDGRHLALVGVTTALEDGRYGFVPWIWVADECRESFGAAVAKKKLAPLRGRRGLDDAMGLPPVPFDGDADSLAKGVASAVWPYAEIAYRVTA
jgi:hypothetical protein